MQVMIQRSTFEWNSLIRRAKPHQALSLYLGSMLAAAAAPNKFTFTFLLKACTHARARRVLPLLHAHLVKFGLHSDAFLCSSLISAYSHHSGQIHTVHRLFALCPLKDTALRTALVSASARLGLPDYARHAFDRIPNPNPVSWAALISGYTRSGRHSDALLAFRRMRLSGVGPTEGALVSTLASAAGLCDARQGMQVHGLIVATTFATLTPALGTALLTMYAKCGILQDSVKVFDEMLDRDQATWTAMISAMAAHGRAKDALRLFDEMLVACVAPDHVTYVGVIHACSQGGMVDEAKHLFKQMRREHGLQARAEHYGCMVDLLGRAGRVKEAWDMARSMPMEPDEYVLKSLLSMCCIHGFPDWAEWAAEKLRKINPGHASSYVMLSNAYAEVGRWEDGARVRRMMRDRGVPKTPGYSAIG